MKVFKYILEVTNYPELDLPKGARILHVGKQHGQLCLWALVDPDAEAVPVKICIVGMGDPFENPEEYPDFLGTAIMRDGALVFHVFASLVQ